MRSPGTGRRERKKAATRNAIAEAARRLLVVDLALDLIERGWQQPMPDHRAAGRIRNERQT
jgi:hypothetical protein